MATNWLRILAFLPLALALSTPLEKRWNNFQTKHAWEDVPRGWVVHDADAPKDHILKMRIGLKQNRFGDLVEELYQVSDPSHERYVHEISSLPQN